MDGMEQGGLMMSATCLRCGRDFSLYLSDEQLAKTARMLTEEHGLSEGEAGRTAARLLTEGVTSGKIICRGCSAGAMN